jgi:Ferritin-like domain
MSEPTLDLAAVDRDGAVRGAAEATGTRAALLGGALAAVGALAFPALASARLASRDRSVLTYALSLEYLQDAFYTEAERLGALTGTVAAAARSLGQTERAHVKAFRALLGPSAPARPSFDFHGTTEDELAFLHTAVALEDLCVGAYAGQATRIRSPEVLQAAVGIHSVEARHAAWLRRLLEIRPTEGSLDRPRARASVIGTIAAKGFVVDPSHAPTTHRRASPLFTG